MTTRVLGIMLVVAGFAVALLLAILGADLIRACRTGPAWKRRLLSAGVGLLAALGVTTTETGCAMCYKVVPVEFQEGSIGRVRYRLRIIESYVQGREVSSFVLEESLRNLQRDLDELTQDEAASKLTDKQRAEAKELREHADRLLKEVQSRPKDKP